MSEPLTPAERDYIEYIRPMAAYSRMIPDDLVLRLLDERDALELANSEAYEKIQTLELQLEQFNADNLVLRAQLEKSDDIIRAISATSNERSLEITTLRARCERLTEDFRTLEPCGHPKNFLIGDEHGHFSCTVCRIANLELAAKVK